ncbi:hypothetical protein BPOR_0115g00120 [Botrytis porri]|uniref:Uncharacterized protein n=1 Tax=Botrytis porri TaxID=87229 RepID=A0A4Z1KXJ8_9HELO|nr:hypothetical protein BPOR_0115g00120 [Botrytis porri]
MDEDILTKANQVTIKHTIDRSLNLVDTISNHHSELHQLEDTSQQLRDLLTLKQQQASIIEATASLDCANETVHQGRSIMIFTLITIVFLPFSFMGSLFGMPAVEYTGSTNSIMGIREQFELIWRHDMNLEARRRNVGSAKVKLEKNGETMVTHAFRWCSVSKAEDTNELQPKTSGDKEQAVTNDESHEKFYP